MRSVKIKLRIIWFLLTNQYTTNRDQDIWYLWDGETTIFNSSSPIFR